jgi:hypothetical protein
VTAIRGRAAVVLCAALVASSLGCFGRSGAPPAPAATAPAAPAAGTVLPEIADVSAMTEEDLDRLVAFLVPHVEAAAEARFTTIPPGRLGSTDALRGVFEVETRQIVQAIYEVPPEVVDALARGARGGVPGLLGKYAASTGAVYLTPQAFADGRSAGAARDAALLVLAHELVHALQDQVAGIDRTLGALEDLDHFDGFRAATEGQANWVTLRVARALGLEDAFWALSRGQGWGPDGLLVPAAFPVFMLYGQGMFMCDHHAEKGGAEAVWRLVREPPRSTTMVFRPERYAPSLALPVDLRGVLRGVEELLTAKIVWVPADTVLGEGPLRGELVGLPSERVGAALEGLTWAFERKMYSEGGPSAGPRSASVRVLSFADAAGAQGFTDLMSEGLEAQAAARTEAEASLAAVESSVQARKWVVEAVPYDRVAGDRVVRRVVGPLSATGARLAVEEEQSLWVVRGPVVVIVGVSGFRPGNRLDRAVDEIFVRLDAALGDGP